MIRIVQVTVFLLIAAWHPASAQQEAFGHDELLAKALQSGPGTEPLNDPYQVLRNNQELKAELSKAILDLEDKYGFRIRVLLRPVWLTGTIQEMAITLQEAWFPDGDGLVMIVETDNRKTGLGVSMQGNPEQESWLMPTHASAVILKRVADRANPEVPLEEYLRNLVLDMIAEHDAFLEKRLKRPTAAEQWKDNLFLIGALAATALGAITVAFLTRIFRTKEQQGVRRFPIVETPERLGAPYGGGVVVTRKIGRN